MTDSTQELDEIFRGLKAMYVDVDAVSGEEQIHNFDTAKQAVLDWHNKQVEAAEQRIADIEFKAGINHVTMGGEYFHKDEVKKQMLEMLDRIEAMSKPLTAIDKERKRLGGQK